MQQITHVVPALFGTAGVFGGAERYVYELARAMSEVVPTRIVSFGEKASTRQEGRLSVTTFVARAVRGQAQNPFSPRLAGLVRDPLVHVHQPYTVMGSFLGVLRRAVRRPTFASDLGGGGWDVSSYVSTDRLFSGHLHISRYSQSLARHGGSVPSRVVYGGVDSEKFRPGTAKCVPGRVAYVGRLLPHKGVDVLIQALPERASLVVLGRVADADYLSHLHGLARGKAVCFVHDATDADILEAYQTARCSVLVSVHEDYRGRHTEVPELLGQTPLEAMACGSPAVVSDAASLPEVVVDGVTGFVVRQRDVEGTRRALEQLLADDALRERMSLAARRHAVETFSWSAVVERCLAAYREFGKA
jgi:glycosyltransferase involved in cell wall biosynthesis